MYDVEAEIVDWTPSVTYPPSELIEGEWTTIVEIPQLDSDADELKEAHLVARKLRRYYQNVRVVDSTPGGFRVIKSACPFTQSHTREWCGYSECRES